MVTQPGDLNNDKLTDYVVVLHKEGEEEISQKVAKAPRRPLLVFVQKPDGTLDYWHEMTMLYSPLTKEGNVIPLWAMEEMG